MNSSLEVAFSDEMFSSLNTTIYSPKQKAPYIHPLSQKKNIHPETQTKKERNPNGKRETHSSSFEALPSKSSASPSKLASKRRLVLNRRRRRRFEPSPNRWRHFEPSPILDDSHSLPIHWFGPFVSKSTPTLWIGKVFLFFIYLFFFQSLQLMFVENVFFYFCWEWNVKMSSWNKGGEDFINC